MKRILAALIFTALIGVFSLSQPAQQFHLQEDKIFTLNPVPSASEEFLPNRYESESSFVSQVYEAQFPFQLLALNWTEELPEESQAQIEIRFRDKKNNWTEWQEIEEDEDEKYEQDGRQSYIITEDSVAFQYRAFLSTADTSLTPKISDISFDYINGGKQSLLSRLTKLTFNDGDLITRKEWGANESLLLAENHVILATSSNEDKEEPVDPAIEDPDMTIVRTVETDKNGDYLWWAQEYPKKVKKIVIHHTATTQDLDDPETAIRAIYHYHAMSRNWGDIGYNYIIDQDGNIYEGRAGGDGVKAGHAAGFNQGTIGIALLGNYENEPLPAAMMQALAGLILEKSELHGIDVDAYGMFRGEVRANLLAHRDVGATTCPGQYAYDYLDDLRKLVGESTDKRKHTNSREDFAYEEVGDRDLITLEPDDSANVSIKIKNTGTNRWTSDTFITVNANLESDAILHIPKDSQKRVAKMKESTVYPGDTATFTFEVQSGMTGGLAHFDIAPIFNGTEKTYHYMDLGAYVEIPYLDFKVISKNLSEDILKPGESTRVTVKLKNTGNLMWENSGENAVTLNRNGTSNLVSSSELANLKETKVKPGEIGTFEFSLKAPSNGGKHNLYFAPKMANSNAVTGAASRITVTVMSSNEDANLVGTSENLTFKPGENKAVWLQIENTSKSTWYKYGENALEIGVTKSTDFQMTNPKLSVHSLMPGLSAKIYFSLTAPTKPGDYQVYLRPRKDDRNLTSSALVFNFSVEEEVILSSDDYDDPIRIKLTPDKQIEPILQSSQSFFLYDGDKLLKYFTANSRVRVTQSGDKLSISSGIDRFTASGPVRFVPTNGGIMKIVTMDQRPGWNPLLNDNKFRGTIEIRKINGELTLINELSLEDYLRGVAEVSNNDHPEKIKTISVLARSYASYYMTQDKKFPGMPFHLDDDPNVSQKYLGYGYEQRSPLAQNAIASTLGQVVTYQGKVIKTPYFSKTDGTRTKSALEVWGWTNTPWLIPVDDTHCSESDHFEGHGVGLSGCGASAMAKDGKTYEEIIRYYYSGVEISDLSF